MKLRSLRNILTVGLLMVALFSWGCGGGGGGGTACTEDATVDLNGTWELNETPISNDCDIPPPARSYTATVVQTGNNITVTLGEDAGDLAGATFTGTVCGNTINWSGSYPDQGGETRVTNTNITATDTSISGTAYWEWSGGGYSCSGSTTITGTKL